MDSVLSLSMPSPTRSLLESLTARSVRSKNARAILDLIHWKFYDVDRDGDTDAEETYTLADRGDIGEAVAEAVEQIYSDWPLEDDPDLKKTRRYLLEVVAVLGVCMVENGYGYGFSGRRTRLADFVVYGVGYKFPSFDIWRS